MDPIPLPLAFSRKDQQACRTPARPPHTPVSRLRLVNTLEAAAAAGIDGGTASCRRRG